MFEGNCQKEIIRDSYFCDKVFPFICFLFFMLWSFWAPYTGDDWAWGSDIGIRRLQLGFQNYNGRYLGNILVLLMTRYRVLKAIIMASAYSFACWLAFWYTGEKSRLYYAFSVLLFLFIPKSILRESVIWASGFANYFPSALISMIFLSFGSRGDVLADEQNSWLSGIGFAFLAFCGGLFMEHITLFHIFWSVCLIIISHKKYKRILRTHWGMLVGSVLGAICMFSNSAYWRVLKENDRYQQIANSLLEFFYIIGRHGLICLQSLVINNGKMCLLLSFFLVLLCDIFVGGVNDSRKKRLSRIGVAVNWICLIVILGLSLLGTDIWILIIQGILAAIYGVSLTGTIYMCAEPPSRDRLLLPVFCIMVVSFPLLFVFPVGPRCFFVSYLFLMTFAINFLHYLMTHWKKRKIKFSRLLKSVYGAVMICMLFYGIMYHRIYTYDEKRNAFAKHQSENGAQTVVVGMLPYEEYLHCSSPAEEPWIQRYKLFHDLKSDVLLELVDLKMLEFLIDPHM